MIDFASELNQQQLEAATFDGGPLLILAGAGSGKTRTLIYRTAYLIQEKHHQPDEILLLTFTNKAAEEMQNRLRTLVGVHLPFAGTFHSFCAKLLRREGHHIGIPTNYLIYDDADQIDLLKLIIKELDLPKQFTPRSLQSQIGEAKNQLLSPRQFADMARGYFQETVAQAYNHYQNKLDKNHALDFDDLLLKTVLLLQNQTQVREYYSHKFKHVLIDEYQDTNTAQYVIAKLLAQTHQGLTAVGDASQSIYRWRGADYRNLDYLQRDFPDLTVIKLERNYRSTQIILDAAYSVIANNTSHPILSLWTEQKEGDKITLFQALDEQEEAQYIIRQLNTQAHATETAVLYRINAQSRALEEACIRAGVPYNLVGGVKFYERKEVKDILSYMRLLQNPSDEVSLNRVVKLGKRRLQAFQEKTRQLDTTSLVTAELFDQVLDATDYLARFDTASPEDMSRIENIKELKSVATQFERLSDFLENVALVEKNTLLQANDLGMNLKPKLTLMTIHASKGLEFDQVFLVGLEEGIFPHSRSLMDSAELEEERRLCYVALTRAKKQLCLTYSQSRLFFGGRQHGVVSRFISEIPENLLQSSMHASYQPSTRQRMVVDDSLIDQFLNDEIDIDKLLG